jgi:hypothetical protein
MAANEDTAEVQYSYPLHAIVLVVLIWAFLMVIIACYAVVAIALFPISPVVAAGGVGLVGLAHDYANSVRTALAVRSTNK